MPDEDKAAVLKALSSVLVEDKVKYYYIYGLLGGDGVELTYKIDLYIGGTIYIDSVRGTFDVNRTMYRRDNSAAYVYKTLSDYTRKYRRVFTKEPIPRA